MSESLKTAKKCIFKDIEFEMHKSFKEFKKSLERLMDGNFSNADAIRSLEDNHQLALFYGIFQNLRRLKNWMHGYVKKKEINIRYDFLFSFILDFIYFIYKILVKFLTLIRRYIQVCLYTFSLKFGLSFILVIYISSTYS